MYRYTYQWLFSFWNFGIRNVHLMGNVEIISLNNILGIFFKVLFKRRKYHF